MSNFLKWLLVPALLAGSMQLYSQYEMGAKRLSPKTFIDSLKQGKVRNITSSQRTLSLMSCIPTAMLEQPLEEVLDMYCNNQLLVSHWQNEGVSKVDMASFHFYSTWGIFLPCGW